MASAHIQTNFDRCLDQVHDMIINMADMVSQELSGSIAAFISQNETIASDTNAIDDEVNASERILDNLIIKSIVLQQPVASDCRTLIAALRISRDLERIGDYATNIANHSQTLGQLKPTGEEQQVAEMGHAVHTMLKDAIKAYDELDTSKAEAVRGQDVEIDKLYTTIFTDLLNINSNNAELASACTHLAFIARSLERIGDYITDIAEEILYIVNGRFPEDGREKADTSAFQTADKASKQA